MKNPYKLPLIIVAILWVVVIGGIAVSLIGCETVPHTTTVKRYQEYEIPEKLDIKFEKVTLEKVREICGEDTYGCYKHTKTQAWIYYISLDVLKHEINHFLYGPAHVNYDIYRGRK